MKLYIRDIYLRFTNLRHIAVDGEISEPSHFGICTTEHPQGNTFGFWVKHRDGTEIIRSKSPNLRYRINDGLEYEMETEEDVQRFRLKLINTQIEELLS